MESSNLNSGSIPSGVDGGGTPTPTPTSSGETGNQNRRRRNGHGHGNANRDGHRDRPPRQPTDGAASPTPGSGSGRNSRSNNRPRHRNNSHPGSLSGQDEGHHTPSQARQSRRNGGGGGKAAEARSNEDTSQAQAQPSRRAQARQRFGGQLTTSTPTNDEDGKASPATNARPKQPAHSHPHPKKEEATDLTSHLTTLLKTPPYPDCPICYSSVTPFQPTWSCSAASGGVNECCWTTFHLKCIKAWASKSVKETKEAYLARNEDHPGEWRCPNCQSKRTAVPSSYTCFCGSTPDPHPPRFATPHSCASPCTRTRSTCAHPCTLQCHPGPCPPCNVTLSVSCHCGKHIQPVKCSHLSSANQEVRSCGEVCAKKKGCGNERHLCGRECHAGACEECEVMYDVQCFCGAEGKKVRCGDPDLKRGGYACAGVCGRTFGCGVHTCEEGCHPHPQEEGEMCPFDPSVVTRCPCGKTRIEEGSRETCKDPVPTCGQRCAKTLGCGHECTKTCHTGSCPPCTVPIERRCRCGATTTKTACHLASSSSEANEILCSTPCPSLRSCGRHQCTTRCCPAANHSSATRSKGKRKAKPASDPNNGNWQDEIERLEREQLERVWHTCEIVCSKPLPCGNHTCTEPDHRGVCPPCLRSSFDELTCFCGRTTLMPPVQCGTKVVCPYPCPRNATTRECGHQGVPHTCHMDDVACPPCPYLTTRRCVCGKNEVRNVRCSSERVGCGVKCGKVLNCGFHHCEKLCHADDCGTCTAVCGKDRKGCLPNHHPCILPCHAPASCDESEPCRAMITLSCPCGRINQLAPCLRSNSTNPSPLSPSASHSGFSTLTREIKCTSECAIAARNARLADALGISQEVRERTGVGPGREVEWTSELRAFGKTNGKFVEVVEKALADFVNGEKKMVVLPSMPETKRKFVHGMGEFYRISSQSVDQEPYRSIQLTRRIDSRIPHPLLSTVLNVPLGKLADLRAPISGSPRSGTPPASATPASASHARGWGTPTPTPAVASSSSTKPAPVPAAITVPTSQLSGLNASAKPFTPQTPSFPAQDGTSVPEHVPDDWEADEEE